jgi:hypothetical protein
MSDHDGAESVVSKIRQQLMAGDPSHLLTGEHLTSWERLQICIEQAGGVSDGIRKYTDLYGLPPGF